MLAANILWKWILNSDVHHFHQHEQDEEPPLTSKHWSQKREQHMVIWRKSVTNSPMRLLQDLPMWVTRRISYKKQELLTISDHLVSIPVFGKGLCCSTFLFSLLCFCFVCPCSVLCTQCYSCLWIDLYPMLLMSLDGLVPNVTHVSGLTCTQCFFFICNGYLNVLKKMDKLNILICNGNSSTILSKTFPRY